MQPCESCNTETNGNHSWNGYVICGDCFADVPAGVLAERILG